MRNPSQTVKVKRPLAAGTVRILLLGVLAWGSMGVFAQTGAEKQIELLEAVVISLAKNPLLELSEASVAFQEAVLQSAAGEFDFQLKSSFSTSRDNTPLLSYQRVEGIAALQTDLITYSLGLVKRWRSGITMSSTATLTRITDQFSNATTPNYAELNFITQIPLLRSRGTRATTANEKAAEIEYEASLLALQHTAAEQVWKTVQAYWNYVAAWQHYNILKASQTRAEALVRETEILIEAGERPRAEKEQPSANLADKVTARIAAEQTLVAARQNLGLVMGLGADEIFNLPDPATSFSEIPEIELLDSIHSQWYIEQALRNRADLLALQCQERSSRVLWEAAIVNARPQLDLNLKLGYSGLDEGREANRFFTPFNTNTTGANLLATLTFALPTNSQQGIMLQRYALYQQSLTQSSELARNICSTTIVALEDLKRSVLRLQNSREAIELYRGVVTNEEKKLQQGISTIIDVIFVEERLTNALLNNISAWLGYANAVVNLRYQTGTLLRVGRNGEFEVSMKELIHIPLATDNSRQPREKER